MFWLDYLIDKLISGLEYAANHGQMWGSLACYYAIPPPIALEEVDPKLKRTLTDLKREYEQEIYEERLIFWGEWCSRELAHLK